MMGNFSNIAADSGFGMLYGNFPSQKRYYNSSEIKGDATSKDGTKRFYNDGYTAVTTSKSWFSREGSYSNGSCKLIDKVV